MLGLEKQRELIDKAFPNSHTGGIWAVCHERLWNEDTRRFALWLVLDPTFGSRGGFHDGWYCAALNGSNELRWETRINLYGNRSKEWICTYFGDRLQALVWISDPT